MTRLRVTDHALLRFMERGAGLDIEGLRDRLATSLAAASAAARSIGRGDYLVLADDLIFVVQGDVLVTVIPERDHVSRGLHARLLRHPDR